MTAVALLRRIYAWGPVLFGLGFIAPLIAQSLDATAVVAPFGLSNLQWGLAVGLSLGLIAKVRGSWI